MRLIIHASIMDLNLIIKKTLPSRPTRSCFRNTGPRDSFLIKIASANQNGQVKSSKPIESDKPLLYRFALPTANHVFLPGHRVMVQVQSSWFPLYDRNPQTFVPNIFWAKPGDYRKAVQRIYHAPGQASFVELPLVNSH
jgi:predicted acyl esterase